MEENTNHNSFMSAEITEISAALSAFQGEVEQPTLNKENPYFKSRYVDLSGVLKSAQKTLAKNGLSVTQIIEGDYLVTLLTHKSGQWFKSVCPIGNYKNQQERGSALTYTKRYAICAILGIAADTDDDGNSATDADKKSGGIQKNQANAKTTGNLAYTGAQLKQAIEEMNAVTDEQGFQNTWIRWSQDCPAICQNGTEFYKAAARKRTSLSNAAR